ncbi:MAG: hypothetical protein IPJ79_14355 [Bacteroidetes bacterium]|nr:hypothetical protein [Bacteroidota bacterium]
MINTINFRKTVLKSHVLTSINPEDIGARQQFILFRIFSFTGAIVALVAFTQLTVGTGISIFHLCILATSLILLVNFYTVNNCKQLKRGYFVSVATAFTLLHIVMYKSGGIRTSGSVYFTIVIVYAFTLLGDKTGRYFTAAAILHIIYTFIISSTTNLTNFDLMGNDVALINRDFLVNFILIFLMIAFVHAYQQSGKNIIIKNITRNRDELQKKNNLLTEYNHTLKSTNRELEKFTNVMSHDLKAPLRAIGSLTDFIHADLKDKLSIESEEHFNIIRGRLTRMENLINGLLTYNKAVSEQHTPEKIDTGLLIHEIKSKLNVKYTYHLKIEGIMPVIKTDKAKIKKVLHELIHNAVSHNPGEYKEVVVKLTEENNNYCFSVSDNGPGINSKYFDKIFVIFQTLQPRDQHESCGIGLSIARKIAHDLEGEIYVESIVGKGSVFSFTMPKNKTNNARKVVMQKMLEE